MGVHAGEPTCELETRTPLLNLSVGLVEDLRRAGVRPGRGPEDFCSDFQICLPYRGLFVWHVGDDDVVGDINQIVFVRAAESFRMSGVSRDYAEMIITPDLDMLSEIACVRRESLGEHPLFKRRSWRADSRMQSFRARFLRWASRPLEADVLEAEELVLFLLRSALQDDEKGYRSSGPTTRRLIRRTKELLETGLANRLRLVDVARAVGASPAYLTDLFRRVEGVSLHKYLTQLRLARALVELSHTEDLTALAIDLGFSSHSHFSFAFRRAFGCTPSEFREDTRLAVVPAAPVVGRARRDAPPGWPKRAVKKSRRSAAGSRRM